jgi:hypothetical protein
LKAQVLHFSEAGPFQPTPAILEDSNMVHPDLWKSEDALRPAAVPAYPRWPLDLVEVQAGQDEPRRPGRSRAIGWQDYLDLSDPRHQPFDWPSAQMMMQLACEGFERAVSAPDTALDPEGPAMLEKLRDLKGATDVMAKTVPFSADIVAVLLAETRGMPAFQPRIPQRRDGRKANGPDRGADAAPAFARPAAPNMLEPTAWQVSYVRYLQDRAKHAYSREPGALPGPLAAHCEDVWREWATHEMGGMGHVPWGKLRSFDPKEEAILLELPSGQLMNWHFGNSANLVLTIRKDDLALGEFGRVSVQVSG